MKGLLCILGCLLAFVEVAKTNGVAILDASQPRLLQLDSSTVSTTIEGQISITTATQYFRNADPADTVKYGFPLNETATPLGLRWRVDGVWYTASVAGVPQDTTLPGGGTADPDLLEYLGPTPLFFDIPQVVDQDSTLAVELTYVELLPYQFGTVSFHYPSNYSRIQQSIVVYQQFDFFLNSQRTIDSVWVESSHPVGILTNDGDSARVQIIQHEEPAAEVLSIKYNLDPEELGLFDYSTMMPDTLVPDTLGSGFLTFIAEPDPQATTETIAKVFTLIVDRSGSMSGSKIVQARDAASFIVENLNEGDRFNIVDFSSSVSSFRTEHVEFTPDNMNAALSYISGFIASGSTNISGAFDVAVPQFAVANDTTANIIVFFTDGYPTAGITETNALVAHIDNLIDVTETDIFLFTFGIGDATGEQLLTLMAAHNNGFAEFLGTDELFERITAFYLTIRNPVLLNSQIAFDPPVVSEVFPDPLPNLYKGVQMIVAGRYQESGPVQITLSGDAFGQPVSYVYDLQLADSSVHSYEFLPKIWAIHKIEFLMVVYYSLDPNSPEAEEIKEYVIWLSQAYGVISPFTSFSGGGTTGVEEGGKTPDSGPVAFELRGNYPNPFNPETTIKIRLHHVYSGEIQIRIYNIVGQLVRILRIDANGQVDYEIVWDGTSSEGIAVPTGTYFYAVTIENVIRIGKMVLLR